MFLDRDGVLNRAVVRDGLPFPPSNLDEVEILPGVAESLRAFQAAGFAVLVVTNQPDVARGTTTRDFVESVHRHLGAELPIDAFYVCYHDSADGCGCRKPLPGMLHAAAQDWDVDLTRSFMVGDRWRDIEAGSAAGCTTVFIDQAYQELQPTAPDHRVSSLFEALPIIKQKEGE